MKATTSLCLAGLVFLALPLAACGDGINSDEAAEAAYIGLDGAIRKSLSLGMDGYNAAGSANIPTQMTTGDVMGTLTVSGQVDMGSSDNKGMRLDLELVDYQDEVPPETELLAVYDTGDALPAYDLMLRGLPDATMEGTLMGTFFMSGDIEGPVTLDLQVQGMTEADPDTADNIRRVVGSTRVFGTATSDFGTYNVDVTL